MERKQEELKKQIQSYGKLAVAFSGGVDSTYLLKVAKDVLEENVIAVTADSCLFPKRELDEAKAFCKENGIRHFMVKSEGLSMEGFQQNPKNRCYLCKHGLFEKLISLAKAQGIDMVAEASNMDDLSDYRPGLAAIQELGVKSPLREAGLYKTEIRKLSKALGLKTYNKPSFACLASRFVYGETITKEKLAMVEHAEQLLFDMGFVQCRVRIHDNLARIEVPPSDFDRMMQEEIRNEIATKLKNFGFSYVSLDLQGYRTGSMNETLCEEELKKETL